MTRILFRSSVALCLLLLVGAGSLAFANPPVSLQASGSGVFAPPNIGTPQGGNAGLVLGDGSGLAGYVASGNDFRLGGVQLGLNRHTGAVQSWTTGHVVQGSIVWPAQTGPHPTLPGGPRVHIMETVRGNIHFVFNQGSFTLTPDPANPAGGVIVGRALFIAIGGTGDFQGARGVVNVRVRSEVQNITPQGAPFNYFFEGFIVLR